MTKQDNFAFVLNYFPYGPKIPSSCFSMGTTCQYRHGTAILEAGDRPNGIMYVHSGLVTGCHFSLNGTLVYPYLITSGFLQVSIFFRDTISAGTILALKDSVVTRWTAETLEELLANKAFVKGLLYNLAKKSILGTNRFHYQTDLPVKEQCRQLLLELRSSKDMVCGEREAEEIHISQKVLATVLGVHPVSVSRVLSEIKEEMHIDVGKKRITFLC